MIIEFQLFLSNIGTIYRDFPIWGQMCLLWASMMLSFIIIHEILDWMLGLPNNIPKLSDHQKYVIRKLKSAFYRWHNSYSPPYGGQPGFYKCGCVELKWVFLKKLEWPVFDCPRCHGSGCD